MALPDIYAWKTKSGKINARAVSQSNGKTLNSISQGFERKQGLITNILSTYQKGYVKEIRIFWIPSRRSKTILSPENVKLK